MRGWFLSIVVVFGVAVGSYCQDSNFATGPQYLMNYGSPQFARSIATPSISLSGPPLKVGATAATAGLTVGAQNQTISASSTSAPSVDLFSIYYGEPASQDIEISFSENSSPSSELPSSILETGVWQLTTAEALRERGYGVTLAEAAANSKLRVRHAGRIYTNADIDRLHGKS